MATFNNEDSNLRFSPKSQIISCLARPIQIELASCRGKFIEEKVSSILFAIDCSSLKQFWFLEESIIQMANNIESESGKKAHITITFSPLDEEFEADANSYECSYGFEIESDLLELQYQSRN